MANAELLMNHLHHRCQAIGGARCRSDNAVGLGRVKVVVHPHHHIEYRWVLDWGRDHHPLCTAIEVALQGLGCEELATAFKHQFDTMSSPINFGRLGGVGDSHGMPIDCNHSACIVALSICTPTPLHRIELQ